MFDQVADDALMATPILVIERAPARDPQGLPLNGRELAKPEIFKLFLIQGDCVLVRAQSQERWILRSVKCRAAKDRPVDRPQSVQE